MAPPATPSLCATSGLDVTNRAVRLSAPPPDPAALAIEDPEDSAIVTETEVAPAATTPKES